MRQTRIKIKTNPNAVNTPGVRTIGGVPVAHPVTALQPEPEVGVEALRPATVALRVPKRTIAQRIADGRRAERLAPNYDDDRRPARQNADDRRRSTLLKSFC